MKWFGVVFAVLSAFAVHVSAGEAVQPFAIHVVDDENGRPVPLVELRTTNEIRYFTDSQGIVAFDEPGLLGKKVFFYIKSHGYEFPQDGFGNRGITLETKAGGKATVKIKRTNLAERLYRITGEGIYRDSVLAGVPVPDRTGPPPGAIMGQDSVQMAEYHGAYFWVWGDTNRAAYPLGNYASTAAISEKGHPAFRGPNLRYLLDAPREAKAMTAIEGAGTKWLDCLLTLGTGNDERMFARYVHNKSLNETIARGWVAYDDQTQTFNPLTKWEKDEPWWPVSHAVRSGDYIYFAYPFPYVRVKANIESIGNPAAYEYFTPIVAGSRFAKAETPLARNPSGLVEWSWKSRTSPLLPKEESQLIHLGKIKEVERLCTLKDASSGETVLPHAGSVAYNEYRKRWIMIFHAEGAKASYLGEVYFAESDTLEGPWRNAVKIVTHDKYSFYNVKHHPEFDEQGGQIIYFEGTYTAMFSGVTDVTPRYDYNQIMYRLDLSKIIARP